MKNTVASIQLNSSDDINENLAAIDRLVGEAKNQGAALVLLPENCAFMGKHQSQTREVAEPLGNGPVQGAFSAIAKTHDVWLIVGAFATRDDNTIYQTLLVYNDAGVLVDYYHKRHLFNVTLPNENESYRESDAFDYGKDIKVVDSPIGRIGLAICYDLRFPEQFRTMVNEGAEIFVLPAAFTYSTGKAHWEILLRARAIENQCFVIASAQTGVHASGRETWGHSMIIDSWGSILDQQPEGEGIVLADIDLTELRRQRQVFPTLSHRRRR